MFNLKHRGKFWFDFVMRPSYNMSKYQHLTAIQKSQDPGFINDVIDFFGIDDEEEVRELLNQYSGVAGNVEWEWDDGTETIEASANKDAEVPTKNCTHKWKLTQGLFRTYKDCTLCGMKGEDEK